ncbi:MAG: hypothetical protein DIU56_010225 [Pseudomonadota bacterium]|jgi:hypothetical protein|nr:MAG: hypothetical protein DIU56_09985 [Pseudomonadota bacterium]
MAIPIESVTVGVGDLDGALKLFRDGLGLQVVNDTRASVGLLSVWGYPVHEGVRLIDLVPPGGSGRLRLEHCESGMSRHTRLDSGPDARDVPTAIGPKAIHIEVAGPLGPALETLTSHGYQRRSEPVRWGDGIEAAAVAGPDGLTLVVSGAGKGAKSTGVTVSAVGASVVTADLEASGRFYGELLGLSAVEANRPEDAPPEQLARLAGARKGARAQVLAVGGGDSGTRVLLVSFPGEHSPSLTHPMQPGQLGMTLLSCRCESLDVMEEHLRTLGIEPVKPSTHVGLPVGRPGRVMLVRGPAGELVELYDLSP